jgi:hypothetical protein
VRLLVRAFQREGSFAGVGLGEMNEHGVLLALETPEAYNDARRDHALELIGVPHGRDLADKARTGVGEVEASDDKGGLEATDLAVGEGLLDLALEIGEVADAAEEGGGAGVLGEVDGEALEALDADSGGARLALDYRRKQFADHLDAFIEGEERVFAGVAADGDDDLVEEAAAAGDDVEVTVGNWVKAAGEDGDVARGFAVRAGHGRDGSGAVK